MTLLADYQKFVADESASNAFASWKKNYKDEYTAWYAFNNAVVMGQRPTPPVMVSYYGKGLVDAAVEYLDSTATQVVTPPPTGNPVPPPASGCYFAAYINGADSYAHYYPAEAPWSNAPGDWTANGLANPWPRFEQNAGKKVWGLMFGQGQALSNSVFDYDGDIAYTVSQGAVPILDIQTSNPGWTLADIAAGKYDTQITAYAKSAAAFAHRFVFRVDAEMNGGWYPFGKEIRASVSGPANFIAAWRHMHDLFAAAGANKYASWHWCPNVDVQDPQYPMPKFESLYPGDAYVDWLGFTGYNHGNESFDWEFKGTYDRLVAMSKLPIMIGEIASSDITPTVSTNPSKVQWLNDMFAKLPGYYTQVKALCWFNWYILENGSYWDWPIESSSGALSAFKAGIANSYFVGR